MNAGSMEGVLHLRQSVAGLVELERDEQRVPDICDYHVEGRIQSCPCGATKNEFRRLSTQLLTIQERERQRIAADLHDVLGQSLTMIKLSIEDSARLLAANETEEVARSLRQLVFKVKDAVEELRRISKDLRPPMLDDLGILPTLSWFFREFSAACPDMRVEKAIDIRESDVPASLKIAIFRLLQEAVGNITKHAKADLIRVLIRRTGDRLHLVVEDNGQGFDQAEMDNYCPLDKGLGLVSMKERAHFSGGVYTIDSAIGKGTRISVSWPLGVTAM